MTAEITPQIFAHLVHLAALELSPDEARYLRQELNNQLKAIRELEAIPLDAKTPITSHGVPYTSEIAPAMRPDEWFPHPNPEDILAQAPESKAGHIVVPDIPPEDIE